MSDPTTGMSPNTDGATGAGAPAAWDEPIAIVGMAAFFPEAASLHQYWTNILGKVDCITEVPPTHWSIDEYFDPDPKAPDKTYCKRGGFLPAIPFDPAEFGIPPQIVKATDTAQLLGLLAARRALEDAGYPAGADFDREGTSCILGVGTGTEQMRALDNRIRGPVWRKVLVDSGLAPEEADRICRQIADQFPAWEENSFPGGLTNVVAGRIANRLNLGGTNLTVDAACASGLAAAHAAVAELRGGLARTAITGAVDTDNDAFMFMCFSKTPAFSPANEVRPFDAAADGILIAEGVGLCVVKRLSDARRDGNRTYAVIRAIGSSSDGRFKSIYAPNPDGQARALRRAYERAGIGPDTVELVEAHGTGTVAGDLAEFAALSRVFREARGDGRWCALGSVKSQIGHAKATAGVAGLIKAALALHQKVLPPTINVREPNPRLGLEASPFYLNTETRPWIRPAGSHPRRAGVSAFGFGGTNFHCVLEEVPGEEAPLGAPAPTSLFAFAGTAAADALRAADAALARIAADERLFKREAQATLARGVRGARAILAVVARSARDLAEKLDAARRPLGAAPEAPLTLPPGVFYGFRADASEHPKVAVLFPGQGSQYVDMGRDWALRYPEVRRAFEDADRVFLDAGDEPLSRAVFPCPAFTRDAAAADEQRLTQTRWAQPALGALGMGLWGLLHDRLGLQAACFGGHSYGELTALWAAGVLDRDAFLELSRARGALMAEAAAAAAPSGMTALAGPVDALAALLPTWSADLVLANVNAPDQAVVAGPVSALRAIEGPAERAGFRVRPLPVSAAFHSPFVAAAREPFARVAASTRFAAARRPVYSNVTAAPYPDNGRGGEMLADQLVRPVNFLGLVTAMHDAGVRVFLEVGPRSALTGLVGRILGDRPHAAIALDPGNGKESGDTGLQKAVGHLLARGVDLDLGYLVEREPLPPLGPAAPSATTVMLTGSNIKPVPPERAMAPGAPAASANGATRQVNPPSASPVAATPPAPRLAAPDPAPPAPRLAAPDPTPPAPRLAAPALAAPAVRAAAPAPATAVPAVPPAPGGADDLLHAALGAFLQQQQVTAEVHQDFLRTGQEAMRTIAQMFEAHTRRMSGASLAPGAPAAATPVPAPPAPSPIPALPVAPVAPPAHPASPAALTSSTAPAARPSQVDQPAPPALPGALAAALLAVVAEKTGYPVEMLQLDMDLEADLGIDSIKRVEILGAMQEQFPDAARVETEQLGELSTLRQVLDHLGSAATAVGADHREAPPRSTAAASTASAHETAALARALLAVVAEKTGYPVEMLQLDMDLEADLGIDSIKRVEILGAMQEQFPDAARVETEQLGELSTLRQVLDHLGQGAPLGDPTGEPGAAPLADPTGEPSAPPAERDGSRGDEGAESGAAAYPVVPTRRYAVRAVPISTGPIASSLSLPGGHVVLVTDDGHGHAAALADELGREGHDVVIAHLPSRPAPASAAARVRPLDWTDEAALARGLAALGASVGAIIHLAALRPTPPLRDLSPSDARSALAEQVRGAFLLARAGGAALRRAEGLFATATALDGGFGLLAPLNGAFAPQGALAGLVKTLAVEWPTVTCRAFDLDPALSPGRAARELARALRDRTGPVETGLADGVTRGLVMATADLPAAIPPDLDDQSVVIVTGGARGVTAEVALGLARRWPLRLVLLGRSPEPGGAWDWCAHVPAGAPLKAALLEHLRRQGAGVTPAELERAHGAAMAEREIGETLARLRAAGSTAVYRSVDVRDAAAVARAVGEARALGTVAGLVHGAGVIQDRLVEQKTAEQFDRVFDTKVLGLHALLEALRDDHLEFVAAFSSIAARTGNAGQADYAMANEALNKMIAEVRAARPACHAVALGWGPWRGGMVTPELERQFRDRGIGAIPADEGVRFCVDEIAAGRHGDAEVVVAALPLPRTAAIDVAPGRDRYLDDHRIDGQPVIPAAMVLEWMAGAAQSACPGMHMASVEDFKVLKGVVCEGPATRVSIALAELPGSSARARALDVRVLAEDRGHERPRYRAIVRLTADPPPSPVFIPGADLATRPFPMPVADAYREWLFHGPRFQVIEAIEGTSDRGMVARLCTSTPSGWTANAPARWIADPAMLDGALQMLVLWLRDAVGHAALPSGLSRYARYSTPGAGERVTAHLRVSEVSPHAGVADVVIVGDDGRVVAELAGLALTVSEHLDPMFRRAPHAARGAVPA